MEPRDYPGRPILGGWIRIPAGDHAGWWGCLVSLYNPQDDLTYEIFIEENPEDVKTIEDFSGEHARVAKKAFRHRRIELAKVKLFREVLGVGPREA